MEVYGTANVRLISAVPKTYIQNYGHNDGNVGSVAQALGDTKGQTVNVVPWTTMYFIAILQIRMSIGFSSHVSFISYMYTANTIYFILYVPNKMMLSNHLLYTKIIIDSSTLTNHYFN